MRPLEETLRVGVLQTTTMFTGHYRLGFSVSSEHNLILFCLVSFSGGEDAMLFILSYLTFLLVVSDMLT